MPGGRPSWHGGIQGGEWKTSYGGQGALGDDGGDFLPPSGGETPIKNRYEVPIIDNSPCEFVLLVVNFSWEFFYVFFFVFFFKSLKLEKGWGEVCPTTNRFRYKMLGKRSIIVEGRGIFHDPKIKIQNSLHPKKLTAGTWKWWFPIGISFSKGPPFSGSMFVLGGVITEKAWILNRNL